MLFHHHEADTTARIHVATAPAHAREIIAVFEDPGHADRYAVDFNGRNAGTDRASKARVIAGDGKAYEITHGAGGYTLTFYAVVRGTIESTDLALFERAATGGCYVTDQSRIEDIALHSVPLFPRTNARPPAALELAATRRAR